MLKKMISFILSIFLMIGVFSIVPITTAGAVSSKVLYFDAKSAGWDDAEWIGFYISDSYNGSQLWWGSKATRGTDDDGDGIWTYDLEEHGLTLSPYGTNEIVFYTNYDAQSDSLIFDETCFGDTAYSDGTFVENPSDPGKQVKSVFWRNADPNFCGSKLRITSKGEIVGTVCPENTTKYRIFQDFLLNYLSIARSSSGKTDQQLIDNAKSKLDLNDETVFDTIVDSGVDVDWVPIVDIEEYIDKNMIYLDTTAISDKVSKDFTLYCYYNGKHAAKRVDKNTWVFDMDTVIPDNSSTSDGGNNGYQPKSVLTTISVYGREINSYPCYFDETCFGDTLVFDGNTVKRYNNDWYDSYYAHWKNKDNSKYGALTDFDSDYNIVGEADPDFNRKLDLLRLYVEEILPIVRQQTIDTDQYIIDDIAHKLGMGKEDVACLIENEEVWNAAESDLPDGFSYDAGCYYLKNADASTPQGYHKFRSDAATGYFVLYTDKPNTIFFNNGSGSSSGTSSSSSGSSGSSSGTPSPPQHTFTPDSKFAVVRYEGDNVFAVVSQDALVSNSGDFYFYRPVSDGYCFGYNTASEVGRSTSSSSSSSSYSNYYPMPNPKITSIVNTEDGLRITWDSINGAEKYRVYVKDDTAWKEIVDTSESSFVYQNAKSGNDYTFTVRCISADGKTFTSDYYDGTTARRIDNPKVVQLQCLSVGNKITWNPVGGNARYRVSVKSRNSWKVLGDTYDTSFIHSSQGEGSIFAQAGVEYTYTVVCVSYSGDAVVSDFNHNGWSITYTGEDSPAEYLQLLGDVDSDDTVTILDATFIQRKLASIPIPFEFNDKVADTDGDGSVSIIDATYIQRWLASLKTNDNIGKPIQPDNEEEEFPYLVNKPVCPSCGSVDVAYIIYGYPLPEESYSKAFREKLNNHEITFGGCVIEPDCPNWYCNTCNHSF